MYFIFGNLDKHAYLASKHLFESSVTKMRDVTSQTADLEKVGKKQEKQEKKKQLRSRFGTNVTFKTVSVRLWPRRFANHGQHFWSVE